MTKKIIRSLTDKEWISENELGTIEEVIEYRSGEEVFQVNAVAHVLSGAEHDAIEAKYSKYNSKTEEFDIDSEGYNKAKMCATFKLDEETLNQIYDNKSSDLRMKMMQLMNRASGVTLTDEEVEAEKNSESPEQ